MKCQRVLNSRSTIPGIAVRSDCCTAIKLIERATLAINPNCSNAHFPVLRKEPVVIHSLSRQYYCNFFYF